MDFKPTSRVNKDNYKLHIEINYLKGFIEKFEIDHKDMIEKLLEELRLNYEGKLSDL